ncbi:hypothetical protein P5G51_019335 [Virgibacillus sp. 179-BFC.A HS]|uniref:Uncharacterized protein n=1 Tax=Tigheibacillus jepli TaxID=3035914 RepID=A0ABU5CLT6_9BACI|nr:hypothetical protein [Virgibacillus sp. 179-BFC.A HS]MDY0407195.1 hypothetical protein [Virgibacillus sp. 179-BFC.A HS]
MRYGDGIPSNNLKSEALWQYIMKSVEQDEQLKIEMEEAIGKGEKIFQHTSLHQEGIIHPSTKKEGHCNSLTFDEYGAVGDLEAENEKEIAEKIFDLGFAICDEEDFQHTLLADDKNKKPIKKRKQTIEIEG